MACPAKPFRALGRRNGKLRVRAVRRVAQRRPHRRACHRPSGVIRLAAAQYIPTGKNRRQDRRRYQRRSISRCAMHSKPRIAARNCGRQMRVAYSWSDLFSNATQAKAFRKMKAFTNLYRGSVAPDSFGPIRLLTTARSETEARTNSVDEYTSKPAAGLPSTISKASQASRNRIRTFWPYGLTNFVCLQ
jgi:hypothetical protein